MRLDISETDLDRGQLIAADAAAQNLVESGRRVELPLAGLVYQRNWEGEIVGADDQSLRAVAFAFDRVLRLIRRDELFPYVGVGNGVARAHDGLTVRTQHSNERLRISCLCRADQGIDRSLRRCESLLSDRRRTPA